jgi:hypothetical protein
MLKFLMAATRVPRNKAKNIKAKLPFRIVDEKAHAKSVKHKGEQKTSY